MQKKYLVILSVLMLVPTYANAWYLNAKSINTTQGTISPSGTVSIANGVNSTEYTVTPKTTAYKVSKVTLDGAIISPNANGKYVALYDAAKAYRYLVAYFTANIDYYNITTSAGANGAVYEDTYESLTNIPAGASRQIRVVPNIGYHVSTIAASAGGVITYTEENWVPVLLTNGGDFPFTAKEIQVTFTNLSANQSVTATFSMVPNHTVNAGPDITIENSISGTLFGSATCNEGAITYAWTGAGLTFGTPAAATTTVSAAADGTYTATLTATCNGTSVHDDANVNFETNNNACTVCHAGSTPRAVTEAGTKVCVSCHTPDAHGDFAIWQQANDYKAGMHAAVSGHTTGKCQRCHTSDGAINGGTVGFTGGYAEVLNVVPYTAVTAADGISCAACHNHTNGLRAVKTTVAGSVVAWDPNRNSVVDQYDVCTQCHSLTNNAGALVGNYHDGSAASVERTISDSHFDDPTTVVVEGYNLRKNTSDTCADCHNLHKADLEIQEQWAESGHAGKIAAAKADALCLNSLFYYGATAGDRLQLPSPGDSVACTDIRSSLSTRTYIEDYKRTTAAAANGTPSANALLKTIGVDPLEAFVHYNWTQTTGTGNRATCEKCHTATGAANYMSNPAGYVATNNNYSHLTGWTAATGSTQQELLYCWGCHSDSQTGALRNPGAVVADYKFQGASAVYPNVQASNTCLTCHVGQASGNSITDLTAANNDFTNVSFVNSHYMAAGALMYAKGGYTNFVPAATNTGTMSYGQSFTSDADQTVDVNGVAVVGRLTSTHRKLGTARGWPPDYLPTDELYDVNNGKGPCVTCHYASGDHTLKLGQKAIDAVCSKCHEVTDTASLEEFLEVEGSAPFEAAINLALTKLAANYNITYNQASYPYFYDVSAANGAVKNWTRSNFLATPLSAADAEKLMGAAFNINLLQRDPAAYAHARTYARRLLFDTIDFLDDGIMNMSAANTAAASGITDANGNLVFVKGDLANSPETTEGYKYLAGYNRTSGAWNALTRP